MKGKKKSFAEKIKNEGWLRLECHPLAVWFGSTFITVFLLELLSRKSLFSVLRFLFMTPHLFFMNFMIVLATYSLMFLTKRWGFVRGLVAIFWGAIGVTDFVLLMFRTTPFNWHDLSLIDSAMQVMNHYVSGIGFVAIGAVIAACIVLVIVLFRKAARLTKRPNYKKGAASVIVVSLLTVYFWSVGRWSSILPRNFSNIAEAYQTYGLAYCFTNSYISTGISKPDNYDAKKVENILDEEVVPVNTEVEIDPVETQVAEAKTEEVYEEETKASIDEYENAGVNVIYLQLESFFDITDLNDVMVNEDPIPNFHRLFETCSSGFLSVPSVGAGTANTEFEILTGMNLDFFGCGEYPYQTVLREQTCESLPYCYDSIGYTSHAIHNNSATFYNRNMVFSRLGFDTFTSMEYMYNLTYTPENWAKDKVLTSNIIEAMKSTDTSDFIYTISVQGHGSYPTDQVLSNPHIKVTLSTDDASRQNQLTYYANQIYEMDLFVLDLIKQLTDFDEPCILVMYGDHLPSLGIEETEMNQGNLFTTKYVLWSNFQMEKQDKNVEAYQLGAYVMQRMGINEGIMFRYHQKYFKEENPNENSYLNSMAIIEYDMLYGDQEVFGGTNPYQPTKLKMGIVPITLDRVVYKDGTMWLYGNNFNEFSIIIINGKQYKPTSQRRNLIKLEGLELDGDVEVCVAQQDNYGKTILSTTKNCKLMIESGKSGE